MTAFDLRHNPANPGVSFDRLNKTKDKNFCMVRLAARGKSPRKARSLT